MLKIRIPFAPARQNKLLFAKKFPIFPDTSATFVFKLKKRRFLRQNITFIRSEKVRLSDILYSVPSILYSVFITQYSGRRNVVFCLKKRHFFNLKTNVALVLQYPKKRGIF